MTSTEWNPMTYKYLVQRKIEKLWVMHFPGGTKAAEAIVHWVEGTGGRAEHVFSEEDADADCVVLYSPDGPPLFAYPGDWVIQGSDGTFAPCKDAEFRVIFEGAK